MCLCRVSVSNESLKGIYKATGRLKRVGLYNPIRQINECEPAVCKFMQTDILRHINTIYFKAITCCWRIRSPRSQWASEKCLIYQGILVREPACIRKICKNAAGQHSCRTKRSCVDKYLPIPLCACCLRKYQNRPWGLLDKPLLLKDEQAKSHLICCVEKNC